MIAPDSPAPSYIHRQKPNKAVVPSVLPDCSYYLRFYNPLSDYSCVYQCTDSLVVRMGVSCSEEVAMRRTYFFIVVLFGMATATFAQTNSSDSQKIEALLGENEQLRQALKVSVSGIQVAQILVS